MICAYPIAMNGGRVPCGQCMNCRINRKRQWMSKLILEWCVSDNSSFLTLTYSDEHLPREIETGLEILRKRDLQLFMKRLRKKYGKLRYYAVGEYGDQFQRPHYHAIMFTQQNFLLEQEEITKIWGQGHVHIGDVNEKSIGYVAQYSCKKLTKRRDERLDGRPREFSLSSTRPGIGAPAIPKILKSFKKIHAQLIENGDIPPTIRFAGKEYPWDRYIKDKLRKELGIPLSAARRSPIGDAPFDFEIEEAKLQELKLKRKIQKRKFNG